MVHVLSFQLDFHASCLYLSKMFLQFCCQHSALLLKSAQYLLLSTLSLGAHSLSLHSFFLSFPFFWAICQYGFFVAQSICACGDLCLKINVGFLIYWYFKVPVNKIDSDEILPSTKNLIKKCFVLIQGRKSVLQCDWSHRLLCDKIQKEHEIGLGSR